MTITHLTRRQSWQAVRPKIGAYHADILASLRVSGPASTKRLAERTRIGLLTVRPRVSELLDLGLVRAIGRCEDGSIFEAVGEDEARENWERARTQENQGTLF